MFVFLENKNIYNVSLYIICMNYSEAREKLFNKQTGRWIHGTTHCDRHGVQPLDQSCCYRCTLQQKKIAEAKRATEYVCRKKILEKLKTLFELQQHKKNLRAILKKKNIVAQLINKNTRKYNKKQLEQNREFYKTLRKLHNNGVLWWNYADQRLKRKFSVPSVIVGDAELIRDLVEDSNFYVNLLTADAKKVVKCGLTTRSKYIQKFPNQFI